MWWRSWKVSDWRAREEIRKGESVDLKALLEEFGE
jgi:hypothetical protein